MDDSRNHQALVLQQLSISRHALPTALYAYSYGNDLAVMQKRRDECVAT